MRIGVFFCQIEVNADLNLDSIAKYAANLPNVDTVQILGIKPQLDVKILSELIKTNNLGRIVIAGDMPGYFKPAFTKAMALAGASTEEIRLASFMEHGARGEMRWIGPKL